MKSPELKSVLAEVIHDVSFAEHDAACRIRAISAFRKQQRMKALRQVTLIAASILMIAYIGSLFSRKDKAIEVKVVVPAEVPSAETASSESTNLLTDEELLAAFPPGSCYLAEVNGQKVLLFHDEKVRAKFFN
jgi:hypothetical protein